MIKIFILVLSVIQSGCADMSYQDWSAKHEQEKIDRLSEQAKARASVPTCSTTAECQNKWEAAQVWVSRNADYKLQVATSAIIETYNSPNGSTDLAMKVTKDPLGNGKYQISFTVLCGNFIGCRKDLVQTTNEFNNYINSIQ